MTKQPSFEESLQATAVTVFSPFEAELSEFVSKYEVVVYNLEDADENKQARSDRLAIGKVISRLDAAHKSLKEPLARQVRIVDGKRKEIKDKLLQVQDGIKSQIKAHEDKLREHQEALQAKIDAIAQLVEFAVPPSSQDVRERLDRARAIDPEDGYEERAADADLTARQVVRALEDLLAQTEMQEAERAELERLRREKEERERAQREEEIERQAADKARREAEEKAAAEANRLEEERQAAIRAKEAAERREKEEAERHNRELEEVRQKAERDAQERLDARRREEEARERDQRHRFSVHNEIRDALLDLELDLPDVDIVKDAIVAGNLPHVSVQY